MEYRILGPTEVCDADGGAVAIGGPRQRRLLAILLVNADRVVSVDRLLEAVWGDDLPSAAETTLQTYVSRLRHALGAGERLVSRAPGYVLSTAGDVVDARVFEEGVAAGRAAVDDGDHARAVAVLGQVLGLWRGRALAEVAEEPWARVEVVRLEELRRVASEELLAARLERGPASDVVGDLERLVAEEPLRERPRQLLMTALYRCGRQAEALRVFEEHRRRLADESGLEPSGGLRLLVRQILDQDPALAPPRGRALRGYRLVEQVAGTGVGEEWLAVQPAIGREVAITMIPAEKANDPGFIRRFESEAQAIARLEHPHIVPLYDYWREAGGAYLVSRHLRGGTLAGSLHARRPVNEALAVVAQLADALAEAHRHGVTHRGLRAESIRLDAAGVAYLSDFGIAGEGEARPSIADDVRSLGVVLAELLAAPQPIDSTLDVASQVRRVRPDVPAGVLEVVATATSTRAGERFGSAAELARACAAARAGAGAMSGVVAVPDRNPYKGLRSFEEADADDLFGRDALLGAVLERLAGGSRFVAMVGASGSGKSSLLKAGLVPAVRRGRVGIGAPWFVTTMTPGDDPLAELAMAIGRVSVRPVSELRQMLTAPGGLGRAVRAALPEDASQLLLVVDQLEEAFTVCTDEDVRAAFLESLAGAAFDEHSRVRIVTGLRADCYDRPLQYRSLAMLLDANTITVVPPSSEELEAVIVGPAGRAGLELEPGLLSRLIADVAEQPSALALLQFTLTELYEQRHANTLTLDAYRAIGGVSGALAHRAEATYAALPADVQTVAHDVLCRLVVVGPTGAEGGRRVTLDQIGGGADPAAVTGVLERFAGQRLLTFDRDPITRVPTVAIAHESLINAWPRLAGWIEDDRDGLRLAGELEHAVARWQASGNDDSELYRGARLAATADWADRHPTQLGAAEGEFLQASRNHHDRELQAAHRTTNRLRRRLIAATLALALAVGAGTLAVVQQRHAARQSAEADAQRELNESQAAQLETQQQLSDAQATAAEQANAIADQQTELAEQERAAREEQQRHATELQDLADARRLGAQASAATLVDSSLALLLAVEARNLTTPSEGSSSLLSTLSGVGGVRLYPAAKSGAAGDVSADNRLVALGGTLTTSATLWRRGVDGALDRVGPELIVSDTPAWVTAAFDPSGTRLAVASGGDNSVTVWDVSDPEQPKQVGPALDTAGSAYVPAWNRDGTVLAVGGVNGARVWHVTQDHYEYFTDLGSCGTAACPEDEMYLTLGVEALAFNPTKPDQMVVKGIAMHAWSVDLLTGDAQRLGEADAPAHYGYGVAFKPDGSQIAVAMATTVDVYDATSGELVKSLPVSNGTNGLTWWKEQLALTESGGGVTIWDASQQWKQTHYSTGAGNAPGARYASDGTLFAFGEKALAAVSQKSGFLVAERMLPPDWPFQAVVRNGSLYIATNSGVVKCELATFCDHPITNRPESMEYQYGQDASGVICACGAKSIALGPGDDEVTIATWGGVQILSDADLSVRTQVGALNHESVLHDRVAVIAGDSPMIAVASPWEVVLWRMGDDPHEVARVSVEGTDLPVGLEFVDEGLLYRSTNAELLIDPGSGEVLENRKRPGGAGALLVDPAHRSGSAYVGLAGDKLELLDRDRSSVADIGVAGGYLAAAFTSDGQMLTTGGDRLSLFDLSTRTQLGDPIDSGFGAVTSMMFEPGISRLITLHDEGPFIYGGMRLAVWDLDLDHLADKACVIAGRNLTQAEWVYYLGDRPYHATCPQYPVG